VEAGGFDPAFTSGLDAQWDLWIRLAERGTRWTVLTEPLVRMAGDGLGAPPSPAADGQEAARRLVDRHSEIYARHLPEVLAGKEAIVRESVRRQVSLARRLDVVLEEERSRLESERRRAKLARPEPPAAEAAPPAPAAPAAEAALAAARAEIEDLRRSASWRVTAPLRALHRWAMRARGRG
jgi:hypothetical protein